MSQLTQLAKLISFLSSSRAGSAGTELNQAGHECVNHEN
jgi:hypothetical protein